MLSVIQEVDEILEEDVLENESVMNVANNLEETVLSNVAVNEEVVASFSQTALRTARDFKNWVLDNLPSLEKVEKVVMIGVGVTMLYEAIKKDAKAAESGGKKVKLSAAIDGAHKVLVEQYDESMHQVAINLKNNTDKWNKMSPEIQKVIESNIAMDGSIYWLTVGQDIMEKLAEMPIYDPTDS